MQTNETEMRKCVFDLYKYIERRLCKTLGCAQKDDLNSFVEIVKKCHWQK